MSAARMAAALVAADDLAVVGRQLGRVPHAMSAVAARCLYGLPAVVECLPADAAGRPFPTLYYCTCPSLVAAVAAVESAGGVRRWTGALASSAALRQSIAAEAERVRRRRRELIVEHELVPLAGASLAGGIAGVADDAAVKCLHAHVAQALAHPGYAFGAAVLAEVGAPWCREARCRVADATPDAARQTAAEGER